MKYMMNIFIWSLLMAVTCIAIKSHAEPMPKYLEGATITVTLKNGKQYSYKAEEHKVVPRIEKPKQVLVQEVSGHGSSCAMPPMKSKSHKNIVSLEVVKSMADPTTETNASGTTVKSKSEVGLGLMYQRNVYKDMYMGGRVDTNRGAGVNIGVGF